MTLVELVIGIALAASAATVCASMMKAGLQTYLYALRQNSILAEGKSALFGSGSLLGIEASARQSAYFVALSSGDLNLQFAAKPSVRYSVAYQTLIQTASGLSTRQAQTVTALNLNYYNMDDNGRIIESTSAARASYMTVMVVFGKLNSGGRSYMMYSGAQSRNHP